MGEREEEGREGAMERERGRRRWRWNRRGGRGGEGGTVEREGEGQCNKMGKG